MTGIKELSLGLISLAIIIGTLTLFAPWWAADLYVDEVHTNTRYAGPFDPENGMITTTSAMLTGIITLLGLIFLVAAAGLLVHSLVTGKQIALTPSVPYLALGGAGTIVIGLVVALLMYPSNSDLGAWTIGSDPGIWDTQGNESHSLITYAAWGWYLGFLAGVLATLGAALALLLRGKRPIRREPKLQ